MNGLTKFVGTFSQELVNIVTLLGAGGVILTWLNAAKIIMEGKKNPELFPRRYKIELIITNIVVCIYIFLLTFKLNLIEIPNLIGNTYANAVQILNLQSIKYECISEISDPNSYVVNYQSKEPGDCIFRWEEIVIDAKVSVSQTPGGVNIINIYADELSGDVLKSIFEVGSGYNIVVDQPVPPETYEESNTSQESSQIPMNSYLISDVSATIKDGIINLVVDKSLDIFNQSESGYPFTWGFHLASSTELEIGDNFIDLEICINDDYSVISVNMVALTVEEYGYLVIEELSNSFDAYFDGQKFTISGDISNDYISIDDLCIQTVYFIQHD